MYPQPPIFNPPPATQFQKNPMIEALLASVVNRQRQPNPSDALIAKLFAGGGGGGGMGHGMNAMGEMAQAQNQMSAARARELDAMMAAALDRARIGTEGQQARLYGAQADTEEAAMPAVVQKLLAEVGATNDLGRERQTSSEFNVERTNRLKALTPAEYENIMASVFQREMGGMENQEQARNAAAMADTREGTMSHVISSAESQAITRGAEAEAAPGYYSNRAAKMGTDAERSAADAQVAVDTVDSRVDKSKTGAVKAKVDLKGSELRNEAAERKATTATEDYALRIIKPRLEALQRLDPKKMEPHELEELQSLTDTYNTLAIQAAGKLKKASASPATRAIQQDKNQKVRDPIKEEAVRVLMEEDQMTEDEARREVYGG